jgi:hypothetical protein
MASASEFRDMATSFEWWARTATTKAERRDFLEMAETVRQAAAELDASADTVRRFDQPKKQAKPLRSKFVGAVLVKSKPASSITSDAPE